jgi:hypothetical protein
MFMGHASGCGCRWKLRRLQIGIGRNFLYFLAHTREHQFSGRSENATHVRHRKLFLFQL